MFLEIYTSINEEQIKRKNIAKENIVCLNISIFIVSLLLSFIIELCNLIPLTASEIIHGINKIFCNNIVESKNSNPFPSSTC